jgi:hypothetical protein
MLVMSATDAPRREGNSLGEELMLEFLKRLVGIRSGETCQNLSGRRLLCKCCVWRRLVVMKGLVLGISLHLSEEVIEVSLRGSY